MVNQIFKGSVHGRKLPWRWAFADLQLLCCRKPKRVVQNKYDGHKSPNDSHNYHDKIELYHEISKRNAIEHSLSEQRTTQNQSYRLW